MQRRDRETLAKIRELAGQAEETRRQRERKSAERVAERDRNVAEAERRCRARSEHERTMDARDQVARRLVDTSRLSFTDAQRVVTESMQKSRSRR